MNLTEETIGAMLSSDGDLQLAHKSRLPPGPVQVTIRAAPAASPRSGLADVIGEIASDQRAGGFPGRSPDEITVEGEARMAEDDERDQELDAARRGNSVGSP